MPKKNNTVEPQQVLRAALNETEGAKELLAENGVNIYDGSVKQIGVPLINNPLVYNRFLTNIYNKFIRTEVVQGRFQNPLAVLKKDTLPPFGDTIERMVFNPAKAIDYNNDVDNILTIVKPDVKVEYIKVNRQDEYRLYIPYNLSMQAFSSESSFGQFLEAGMASMYNGDSIDEFRLMLKCVSDIYNMGYLNNMAVSTDMKDTTSSIINTIKLFKIPSVKYNAYSRLYTEDQLVTWSNPKRIVIIAKAEFITKIRMDVLASVFNLNEVELEAMIIEVDEFENEDIEAFVGDLSYFRVHDVVRRVEEFQRADKLATKSYYHVWQAMQISLFANAMVFCKAGYTPPTPQSNVSTGSTDINSMQSLVLPQ